MPGDMVAMNLEKKCCRLNKQLIQNHISIIKYEVHNHNHVHANMIFHNITLVMKYKNTQVTRLIKHHVHNSCQNWSLQIKTDSIIITIAN